MIKELEKLEEKYDYILLLLFRNLEVETAYEYLEKRFDKKFRFIGSITFIIFHIIRIAIVTILGIIELSTEIKVFEALNKADKIIILDIFSLNLVGKTLIGIIIGGFLSSIYVYVGSQDIVQRYSATESVKEVKKSLYRIYRYC